MLIGIDYVAPPGAFWPDLYMFMSPGPTELLQIRNVTGLEPVVATVNTRGYGVVDGEFYTGSSVPKRNVVITVGLNTIGGAATVAAARDLLYRYFLPKNEIKLRFNFDNRPSVVIDGVVESITGDRFSKDPEMQISVICPKPYFQATAPTDITGFTWINSDAPITDTTYLGDTGAGIIFRMPVESEVFSGDLELRKYVADSEGFAAMIFRGMYVPQHWVLEIDTRQGRKRVEAVPPDTEEYEGVDRINLFPTLDDTTYWMQLFAGESHFQIVADGIARAWGIEYTNQFVGV